MLDPAGQELRDELLTHMRSGGEALRDEAAFREMARRVFSYNYHQIPAYGAYCRARGCEPAGVVHWTEIPAVPTAAFKELVLRADGSEAERVFRTSGTTRGPERRGEHHVVDLTLYQASLRAGFEAFLLPDRPRLTFYSLVPPPDQLPDSSLSFMVDDVRQRFGASDSETFANAGGIDIDRLDHAMDSATATGRPVMLLGTTAAFIHWLDRLSASDRGHHLPAGSRLMDTGGYKGGGRQVDPEELREAYQARLGIPPHMCVNEYGMTEMLSQLYDTALRDEYNGMKGPPRKAGLPWLRSVAVDPETLQPLPAGRSGILRHLDLANLGSVAAIQTEDFGMVDDHGVVIEGRAAGAPPRGCSIAMDIILGGVQ
jgi:hypothetical protein